MPNFKTVPKQKHVAADVAIYHALPHGLRDQLRRPIIPELFVNTATVHRQKREALAAHASQKQWLDATQGMNSYLAEMDAMAREVGKQGGLEHAEGWRRHLHLGFSARDYDPLSEVLKPFVAANPDNNSETN